MAAAASIDPFDPISTRPMKLTASSTSLFLAALVLGASCAGPRPAAPAAPAAAPTPAPSVAATAAAPVAAKTPAVSPATGRPEIRYYEISAA